MDTLQRRLKLTLFLEMAVALVALVLALVNFGSLVSYITAAEGLLVLIYSLYNARAANVPSRISTMPLPMALVLLVEIILCCVAWLLSDDHNSSFYMAFCPMVALAIVGATTLAFAKIKADKLKVV